MKIVELKIADFKRIRAVDIRPGGNIVKITGKNGSGKTSTLDAIQAVLGGERATCSKPVRVGTEKSTIVCELDDYVVRRTITESGGGTLTVSNKDGARYTSPQSILDKIIGKLTFDPLAFSRMEATKQVETLRELVGLDFTEINKQRKELYESRYLVNKDVKSLESQFAALAEHKDVPAEEISVADLVAKLEEAQKHNAENQEKRHALEIIKNRADAIKSQAQSDSEAYAKRRSQIAGEIERLQKLATENDENAKKAAEKYEKMLEEARSEWKDASKLANEATDINTQFIQNKITEADSINRNVRSNKQRAEIKKKADEARQESDSLTKKIDLLDAQKSKLLAETKFPVAGLGFGDDGVVFNGIPFDQCSSAEQIRISVAIGAAMNPKLRVLLIRDGSLLDSASMKALEEIAAEKDMQVWLEKVDESGGDGVVIEDGCVVAKKEKE